MIYKKDVIKECFIEPEETIVKVRKDLTCHVSGVWLGWLRRTGDCRVRRRRAIEATAVVVVNRLGAR
ncbi:hypothetical protein E2C01_021465 [Portunus trituberculatus]|uniref:Uncharacterized protein n=1 Tax=Portunus trituberculatus TaxID=210409 RepID=A0A5B7E4G6_PORTR|nr:hypothetical protein [Portunus trituberculatus]